MGVIKADKRDGMMVMKQSSSEIKKQIEALEPDEKLGKELREISKKQQAISDLKDQISKEVLAQFKDQFITLEEYRAAKGNYMKNDKNPDVSRLNKLVKETGLNNAVPSDGAKQEASFNSAPQSGDEKAPKGLSSILSNAAQRVETADVSQEQAQQLIAGTSR